jgi:hypothetical protein
MSTIWCILNHISFTVDKPNVIIWLPHLDLLCFEVSVNNDAWPIQPSVVVVGEELCDLNSERPTTLVDPSNHQVDLSQAEDTRDKTRQGHHYQAPAQYHDRSQIVSSGADIATVGKPSSALDNDPDE